MLVALAEFFENSRTMNNLYFKYLNASSNFNETVIGNYKNIFSNKVLNNLINLLNMQIVVNNGISFHNFI